MNARILFLLLVCQCAVSGPANIPKIKSPTGALRTLIRTVDDDFILFVEEYRCFTGNSIGLVVLGISGDSQQAGNVKWKLLFCALNYSNDIQFQSATTEPVSGDILFAYRDLSSVSTAQIRRIRRDGSSKADDSPIAAIPSDKVSPCVLRPSTLYQNILVLTAREVLSIPGITTPWISFPDTITGESMYINNDTIYISGTFHGDDGSSGIFSRQYNAGATLQVEDKLDNSVLNRNLTVGNPGAVLSITPNEYVNCGGYLYFTTYSQVNQTLRISLYNTGDPKGGIQKSNSNVIPKDDIVVWQTCTNSTTIGSKIDSKLLILVHNASSDDSSQYIITVDNNLVISQPKSIQASKETIKIDSTDQSVNFRFGILEPLKDNLNFLSIEYAQVDQIPPTSRNAMVGPYSLKIYSKTLIDWNTSSDLPKNSSNDPTISDCPSHYFLNRTTGACMKCLPTTPSIECAVSGSLWDPWVWGNLNVQQIIFISSVSGVVFVAMVISAWIFHTKRKKKLSQKNVSRPQNSVVFNIPNSNTTAPTFKDIVNPQTETVDLNNGINLQAPKPSSKRMIIQSSSIPQRLSADMSKLLQRLSRISNSSIEELEVKKDVNILNSGKNPFEVEGKANVQDETIATTDAATALRPISLINPKHHPLPDKTAEDDRASISSSSTGSSDSDGPVLSKSAQARLSNRLQPHIRAARESAEASNKYQRPSHHSSKPLTSNSSKSNLHRTSERDSTRIRHPDSLRYSTNRLSTTHYPSHRASQYHVPGGYGAVVRQSFHPQDPRLFHTYQQVNPYAPASIVTAAQPMYYPQPQVHIVHQRPPYGVPTSHSHHNRAKGKKESSHETRKRRVKEEKEDSGKTDKLVES